ncbi:uncharacterized protein [Miscanthus floridulus]|uniref:uncharacterized protein isoform X2 n=1 Tax=Miscanthus floridulus TaxID=154761 RepID=UPI00345B0960
MGAARAIQVNLLAFSEEFDLEHQDEPERTNIIEKKGKHRSYSNRGPAGKSTKISCSCIFRFPSQKIQKGRAKATGKRNCTQDLSQSAKEVNKVPFRCVLYKVQENLLLQPTCIKSLKTYDVLRV